MTNVIEVFNEEQINEKLNKDFKDWTFDGKWIRKTYKTHSWKGTLMLVNAIGHLSEIAWHHPDLVVSYAFVEVKLMNHAKKGITQLDFDLAKKIDEFILWNPKEEGLSLEGTPDDPRFAYVKTKNKKADNYSLKSSPMIKGKAVNLKEAILEITKILKASSSIHIDGMDCDVSSIDTALRFAEKKNVQSIIKAMKK